MADFGRYYNGEFVYIATVFVFGFTLSLGLSEVPAVREVWINGRVSGNREFIPCCFSTSSCAIFFPLVYL